MRSCAQSLQRSHFNRSLRDTIPPVGGFRVSSVPPAVIAHASTAASRCQRYSVPAAQIRCISTASLRATATAARRRPRRFAMPSPQTRMPEYFLDRGRSASADWYRTARIAASPHLEMVIKRRQVALFADHLKHHFVKDSALLPKGSARDEHRAHRHFKVRRLSYQLENAASNGPAVIRPVSLIPNTLRVPRI